MAPISEYLAARTNMVESQIRPNKVTDHRLVESFLKVPRELFVPKAMRGIAYVDHDLQVARGRWLMEPMVLARLLQAAEITRNEVALVVGCGTGYAVAVAAALAATVVAVECDETLAAAARQVMQETAIDNALIMTGPLAAGWARQKPYDVILIDGAVAAVPQSLLDQLTEGGRLVAVVRSGTATGEARLYQRIAGTTSYRVLFDASTRLMPGFEAEPAFVF